MSTVIEKRIDPNMPARAWYKIHGLSINGVQVEISRLMNGEAVQSSQFTNPRRVAGRWCSGGFVVEHQINHAYPVATHKR